MDSTDLLAREAEYKKLNQQLEKKTVTLMKEIENVMQKQDIFSEFSPTLSLDYNPKPKLKHSCNSSSTNTPEQTPVKKNKNKNRKNNQTQTKKQNKNQISESGSDDDSSKFEKASVKDGGGVAAVENGGKVYCDCCSWKNNVQNNNLEFLYAFVSVNVQDKVLPTSFLKDSINIESVCKFLVSKIKLMQEQIDKLQSVIDRKVNQCELHLTQIAEYESERLKLLNKSNSLLSEVSDSRGRLVSLQNKLNDKERLYKEQRSESDKLSSEVKRLRCRNANVEAKSAGQEQEIEKFKQHIDNMKVAEKEFRLSSRNLCLSHTAAITKQESHIKQLKQALDKQNKLIANLRKQLACTAIYSDLKGVENDFNELLKS